MNYYKQGDAANADQIKAAFEAKGISDGGNSFIHSNYLYFSEGGEVDFCGIGGHVANLIKAHPDYKELELPVQPKFKAEDRIVSKSDKSTIYRIITLHEERREYIVEIEHKDFHESCPWIAFEDQDDYELAPKPHYDIANFHAGMPVLVRDYDNRKWCYLLYSHYNNEYEDGLCFNAGSVDWRQCIPFNEDTKHLLGTTDMPSEEYINW